MYNSYYPGLHKFVQKIVDHQQEADDITAIAFEELWKNRTKFEVQSNITAFQNIIRGYLYTVAYHASMDYWRKLDRNRQLLSQFRFHLQKFQDIPDEGIRPEDITYLYKTIEHMPVGRRKVMESAFVEGLTNHQTAKKLGLNNEAVRFQKSKGVALLRQRILARLNEAK